MTLASKSYFPTPPLPAGWPKKVEFETIGYRCSKTALNMLMLDWNHKLKEDGVKVWGVGPGMLATNLGNKPDLVKKMGLGHPSIGGKFIRTIVEGERDADVGRLVNKDGFTPFWVGRDRMGHTKEFFAVETTNEKKADIPIRPMKVPNNNIFKKLENWHLN
jgi:NAD(P)-dependent dehydrogenase (short-subunit alcohol dehydrogenase family)